MMDFPGWLGEASVRVVGAVRAGYSPPWIRIAIVEPEGGAGVMRAAWDSLRAPPQRWSTKAVHGPEEERHWLPPQPDAQVPDDTGLIP
jgi:hypothetical protein